MQTLHKFDKFDLIVQIFLNKGDETIHIGSDDELPMHNETTIIFMIVSNIISVFRGILVLLIQ